MVQRELKDLMSVGPAMIQDFRVLGIHSVDDLCGKDAKDLYNKLCRKTEKLQNPEILNAFEMAISQAEKNHI